MGFQYSAFALSSSWLLVLISYLSVDDFLLLCLPLLVSLSIFKFLVSSCGFFFSNYRGSFRICCKAGLVVLNSPSFCLSVRLLIYPSNLIESLSGYSILGCRFFTFNISYHSLWHIDFLLKNQLITLWGFLFILFFYFSLVAFNIFSFTFFFSLINMGVDMLLLVFILYVSLCASWTCMTVSFPMLGKFSAIISSNTFSDSFFFSGLSGTPIKWILVHLKLSQKCLRHYSFLLILLSFFLSFFLSHSFSQGHTFSIWKFPG